MTNSGRSLMAAMKKLSRASRPRKHRPSIGGRKLTHQDVHEIRSQYAARHITKVTQADLAREFGVSPSTINDVVHQKSWKQVG